MTPPAEGDHGNDPNGREPTSNTSPCYGHLRDRTLTMPSRLLLAFILLVCAHRAAAQTPSPGPLEVIRLADGSLVGRVILTDDGKIHMFVVGLGEVGIDPADVDALAACGAALLPSPWSGHGDGSRRRLQRRRARRVGLDARRTADTRSCSDRSAAWSRSMGRWESPARRSSRRRRRSVGGDAAGAGCSRRAGHRDGPQPVRGQPRAIPAIPLYDDRRPGLLVPEVGPSVVLARARDRLREREQTELGRVFPFAAGIPPGVDGPITGLYDMVTLRNSRPCSASIRTCIAWSSG
ncbi:MAG: hypothetical protein MZV63_23660 [Marinilabiliales bacterium]|nr:hypothetical protein [Marinilabiliales bacterium]